jgi:O-antigen/teichoic acid export membrane protein
MLLNDFKPNAFIARGMLGRKTLLRNIGHLMAGNMIRSTVMVIFTIYIIRIISVHDFGFIQRWLPSPP